jgi:hypothetical protein
MNMPPAGKAREVNGRRHLNTLKLLLLWSDYESMRLAQTLAHERAEEIGASARVPEAPTYTSHHLVQLDKAFFS